VLFTLRQTALERQDLSRTFLAHHELESKFNTMIMIMIMIMIDITIVIIIFISAIITGAS